MENQFKIMFFDIDGTLIDHENDRHAMPLSTVASLRALQKKGVKLFVATGRVPGMLEYLYPIYPFDGYVTTNGQYVHERDGKVLRMAAIDPAGVKELAALAEKEDFSALLSEPDASYALHGHTAISKHYGALDLPVPPKYDFSRLGKHPVIQCLAYIPVEKGPILEPLTKHMRFVWTGGTYDVLPADGGKDVGAQVAAEAYGCSAAQAMGFGDGDNDADLLRWAGVGVAMGNGSKVCKEAADYVTDKPGEDGIMKALLHFGALTGEEVQEELDNLKKEGGLDRFTEHFPGRRKPKKSGDKA